MTPIPTELRELMEHIVSIGPTDYETMYRAKAQLKRLLAPPPADAADMGGRGEEVEVRGLQWLDTGHYRKKPPQFGYNPHDWNPLMTIAQHHRILAQRDAAIEEWSGTAAQNGMESDRLAEELAKHRQQAGKLVEALRQVRGYTDSPHVVGVIDEALADWEKTNA